MKIKKKMLGYCDYTVVLTFCGMISAFCGIMQVIGQSYWSAVFCLMFAGVCDMFDGTVAATKLRTADEKSFGIQIDSLSDLISFGVLPGVFVYMVSDRDILTGGLAALFVLCALIRLAYFNVLEEERQKHTTECRKSYSGVPVTTIAILLPAVYLLYDRGVFRNSIYFSVLLILTGIGFISPVEIKKPGITGKIGIIILGIFEALGMVFFMGWDAV